MMVTPQTKDARTVTVSSHLYRLYRTSGKDINNPSQTLHVAYQYPSLVLINSSRSVTSPKIDYPRVIVQVDQDILGLGITPDDVSMVKRL